METILRIEETTFRAKDKHVYNELDGFIVVTDKQTIKIGIENSQQCCEHFGYFMTEDNLDEFVGANLLSIHTTDTCRNKQKLDEVDLYDGGVMFVDFETDRGVLQFVAYNCQNGYYGHDAVIESAQLTQVERL